MTVVFSSTPPSRRARDCREAEGDEGPHGDRTGGRQSGEGGSGCPPLPLGAPYGEVSTPQAAPTLSPHGAREGLAARPPRDRRAHQTKPNQTKPNVPLAPTPRGPDPAEKTSPWCLLNGLFRLWTTIRMLVTFAIQTF